MSERGRVVEVRSAADYWRAVEGPGPVAVDFNAEWCGPCRQISPLFAELAAAYPAVTFLAVDVDERDDVAKAERVRSLPTFKFFAGGRKVDEFTGAKAESLRRAVEKLAPAENSWAEGSGSGRKRPDTRPDTRSDTRSGERSDTRASERSDTRSGERSGEPRGKHRGRHAAPREGAEDY